MEKQGSEPVGAAQRTAGVTALHCVNHPNDIAAHLRRNGLEFLNGGHFLLVQR
jgi:hypothetical protein